MLELKADITTESQDDNWKSLPAEAKDVAETILSRRRLRNWSLVLEAHQIPWQTRRRGFGSQLLVPGELHETATREVLLYESENRDWPPSPPRGTPLVDNRTTTLWMLIAIGVFYNVTLHDISLASHAVVDWTFLGNAHAGKIMNGQWWRLATALTLHADWQHLLGNLLIGGVFISRLCRDLKSGPAWLLLLLAGVFGNLANAWLQHPAHRAVGASTSIFGVVGLLAAISMVRYRHNLRPRRRWTLPVAAALGLLAMLGAGGENTDIGAHLFGFLFGLPLGLCAELLLEKYGRPGKIANILMGAAALSLIVGAWWSALLWGS